MLRCIAVDDEPFSLKIVEKYVADMPNIVLLATCSDAFQAMEALRREQVDLMFLDINMPKLSGLSLVKALDKPPLIIFTTAYPEYAVDGFELEAVDYLLKPFSLERFMKAVNRAIEKLQAQKTVPETRQNHLIIKADKKLYKVDFQDIVYLEGYGDYVKIFTKEKMLLTKERLTILEELLPKESFLRIHRSYIISMEKIEFIEGNLVKIGQEKLPIVSSAKEELMGRLKNN